jgi:nucleotide-binding universal stress UspA family protein
MNADAVRRLGDLRAQLLTGAAAGGQADLEVNVAVAHGKPFVEIVRRARHGRAELIVLGRHGERTFRELLVGSTAERVIRKGDVSVLVVASPGTEPYRRPLVAFDLSDSAQLALELTLRICQRSLDRVDVLHVVELPIGHVAGAAAGFGLESLRQEKEERARVELAALLASVGPPGRWNLIVETGDPRQVILDQARTRGADLVALGTHGRTGLPHVLVGSVAEAVIRGATADVLVGRLPRRDFSLP